MKRIRLDLGFLLAAAVSGGIAFLFGLARESTLAVLWLINANVSVIAYCLVGEKK
jgi:hypothetical protein